MNIVSNAMCLSDHRHCYTNWSLRRINEKKRITEVSSLLDSSNRKRHLAVDQQGDTIRRTKLNYGLSRRVSTRYTELEKVNYKLVDTCHTWHYLLNTIYIHTIQAYDSGIDWEQKKRQSNPPHTNTYSLQAKKPERCRQGVSFTSTHSISNTIWPFFYRSHPIPTRKRAHPRIA